MSRNAAFTKNILVFCVAKHGSLLYIMAIDFLYAARPASDPNMSASAQLPLSSQLRTVASRMSLHVVLLSYLDISLEISIYFSTSALDPKYLQTVPAPLEPVRSSKLPDPSTLLQRVRREASEA